jgi:membrane peptidoglycan carboxypeptidase
MVAAFVVGPENPDFAPFEQISPFLRAAVMTSEDGSFFFHNGFNPNAFRESIVTNIKEKRFARGGSTISMQLVKNVFLTRNKTLARKIEEALIVWMIENKHLVSKQRMYEVYLNIIEWGPGIYGINQASRFYFDKKPYDLNLTESIYLASIVPHPKWYKYTFESNGITRPFFKNYYDFIVALMLRREHLTPLDTVGVYPTVLLTGPASQVFTRPDPAELDTVKMDDLQILPLLESF